MVGPICPQELTEKRTEEPIYGTIFQVINEMIKDKINYGHAYIDMLKIKAEMAKKGISPEEIKKIDWSDISFRYKMAGWSRVDLIQSRVQGLPIVRIDFHREQE